MMGWSIGFDTNWNRDIGYGVPATCDHPDCNAKIDRGLAYVCANQQPYGGEDGCGLYFCHEHLSCGKCERCEAITDDGPYIAPFVAKPDHPEWINWKLTDSSWQQWRDENPAKVALMRAALPEIERLSDARPGCSCEACRPLTMTDMRMVLCETCGNKRCPHATNHRNACTNSNDVGQPGSSWEHKRGEGDV